jgi:hypothetical protein
MNNREMKPLPVQLNWDRVEGMMLGNVDGEKHSSLALA